MKRLALAVMIICLLVPASVYAQAAGAFANGFAQGLAASRGYPPPVIFQPSMPAAPQINFGSIYTPNQMANFTINQFPSTGYFTGTIYGINGSTNFSGMRY